LNLSIALKREFFDPAIMNIHIVAEIKSAPKRLGANVTKKPKYEGRKFIGIELMQKKETYGQH